MDVRSSQRSASPATPSKPKFNNIEGQMPVEDETFRLRYETHPHKLHCNKLETFSFEALDNVSDKSTLDAIGFNHQKTAFSVRHVRCFYCKTEKENQNVQFSAAENSFKKLKRHLIER